MMDPTKGVSQVAVGTADKKEAKEIKRCPWDKTQRQKGT